MSLLIDLSFHLKIIGTLLLLLSGVHIGFPKYFKWQEELPKLSLINRQMMQVHTFFIAFMLLLMGALCLFTSQELVASEMGKIISLGFGIFWGVRLLFQFFGYSRKLWVGKPFETAMHILFSLLWVYFSSVFLLVGLH